MCNRTKLLAKLSKTKKLQKRSPAVKSGFVRSQPAHPQCIPPLKATSPGKSMPEDVMKLSLTVLNLLFHTTDLITVGLASVCRFFVDEVVCTKKFID